MARLRVRIQELPERDVVHHRGAQLRPLQRGQRAQAAVQSHIRRGHHIRIAVAQLAADLRTCTSSYAG